MARTTEPICCHLPDSPMGVRTHGQGENRRHLFRLEIHQAPAAVGKRDVELVMTDEELLEVAIRLLGGVPVFVFDGGRNGDLLNRLRKYMKMFETSATNPV